MSGGPLWTRIWNNLKSDAEAGRDRPISADRDMTAAVGTAGAPASWKRAEDGADVALHQRGWADARWSSIFRRGSDYAVDGPVDPARVAAANLRGRRSEPPEVVQGPVMKAPVWTWEVPLYFWFGGMAAGATFVAAGCDLAGDRRSARIARGVALVSLVPSPPLLIMDLGRPERFYNMLRIFKPRSPMSMGSWCLSVFGGLSFVSVAADVLGYRRTARAVGAVNVPVGMYLGSYTGVLLAATAVPVWARSRRFLGPIFISTATLTGASVTRLVLTVAGAGPEDPTRVALARIEDGAMATELILSAVNEHQLGWLASGLHDGQGAEWFTRARWLGRAGLAARVAAKRVTPAEHVASVCFAGAALCYRFAWVRSGVSSAEDDVAVARASRERAPVELNLTRHGEKPPTETDGA
jgi:hypothetical protein